MATPRWLFFDLLVSFASFFFADSNEDRRIASRFGVHLSAITLIGMFLLKALTAFSPGQRRMLGITRCLDLEQWQWSALKLWTNERSNKYAKEVMPSASFWASSWKYLHSRLMLLDGIDTSDIPRPWNPLVKSRRTSQSLANAHEARRTEIRIFDEIFAFYFEGKEQFRDLRRAELKAASHLYNNRRRDLSWNEPKTYLRGRNVRHQSHSLKKG